MTNRHVMLDLETLSTSSNAAILSIGAISFTKDGLITDEEPFHVKIDLQSCIDVGLQVDVNTILWWMQQNEDARQLLNKPGWILSEALRQFTVWFSRGSKLWGNGAAFDNVVLKNAYKAINKKEPWTYQDDMCYRTLWNMFPDIERDTFKGTKHDALDDAVNQVSHLLKICNSKGIQI